MCQKAIQRFQDNIHKIGLSLIMIIIIMQMYRITIIFYQYKRVKILLRVLAKTKEEVCKSNRQYKQQDLELKIQLTIVNGEKINKKG